MYDLENNTDLCTVTQGTSSQSCARFCPCCAHVSLSRTCPQAQVSTAAPEPVTPPETTPVEARAWLAASGLLEEDEDDDLVLRRYKALSKCKFGEGVSEDTKRRFLQRLIPCEFRLAAKQTDIGEVQDPRYLYRLRLNNATPVRAKPMRLRPKEEAWLDVHLDELLAKGVIGPILPHEQPRCVTPLLLVPGQQSGQPYRVC